MSTELDFEKPVRDLQEKLEEMRHLQATSDNDLSSAIGELETNLANLKKRVYSNLSRWQRVQLARHPQRPYTLDYIRALSPDFVELHGDRQYRDDKAIVGGWGWLDDQPVMLIGHQKGRDTRQRKFRNFGMANPEGYRKALRLMKQAEKFGRPIVTFIDTPGAFPGLEAEERGQGEAIARNLLEMARLRAPLIALVIGEGASGGALGIGLADRVYMLENTWYSVISPESCSSILWRNWEHKEEAAEALKLTARDNLELGLIDGIIEEPLGGAHQDPEAAYQAVRQTLLKNLPPLMALRPEQRVAQRIDKFAHMGLVMDGSTEEEATETETS